MISRYLTWPIHFALAIAMLGACKANDPETKLRCAVSREDAGFYAVANAETLQAPSRPPGWLRPAPEKTGNARDARAGRLRGEVLYLDGRGNLVRVRDKKQVPPEFRGAMVARSGSLGAPGSYSVIDFAKLPEPSKKQVPAARTAHPSVEKPSGATERLSVKVFGTSWCKACQRTKSYLAGKNISFAMRDIEGDSAALAEYTSYGGNEVPLVVIGETVIRGFAPAEIDRALGL